MVDELVYFLNLDPSKMLKYVKFIVIDINVSKMVMSEQLDILELLLENKCKVLFVNLRIVSTYTTHIVIEYLKILIHKHNRHSVIVNLLSSNYNRISYRAINC